MTLTLARDVPSSLKPHALNKNNWIVQVACDSRAPAGRHCKLWPVSQISALVAPPIDNTAAPHEWTNRAGRVWAEVRWRGILRLHTIGHHHQDPRRIRAFGLVVRARVWDGDLLHFVFVRV
jgi:hypothetical protein